MLLPLILLSSTVLHPSPSHMSLPANCYFATGFTIPKIHYDSLSAELVATNICRSPVNYVEDGNDLINKQDIPSSSSKLKYSLPKDETNWILLGHSRGGAVAAYTAASMEDSEGPNALILIDPVDDESLTSMKFYDNLRQSTNVYEIQKIYDNLRRSTKNRKI